MGVSAALVSAAKVMRCIQSSLVCFFVFYKFCIVVDYDLSVLVAGEWPVMLF